MKTDRLGNMIGTSDFHASYWVADLFDFPQVSVSVSKSETTESVYVTYTNTENSESITVRFSHHENNATRFGDQLNGHCTHKKEILFRIGLWTRKFVPNTYLYIEKRSFKKNLVHNYEFSDLTIQEMYALGAGTDISAHTGKVAKDSNCLITGNTIELCIEKRLDCFGNEVQVGRFIYE